MSISETPEWYYVGHYGQLGPLSLQNMSELAADGVIEPETFVWRPGMADWLAAKQVPEISAHFVRSQEPPPVPSNRPPGTPTNTASGTPAIPYGTQQWLEYGSVSSHRSDKSVLIAAFLNIIPGFGRFYLGYMAHGILQFMTACVGIGFFWSWLDSVFMLVGGVKRDGYGRPLDS